MELFKSRNFIVVLRTESYEHLCDEASELIDVCRYLQHVCENGRCVSAQRSYRCLCNIGYRLTDPTTCTGIIEPRYTIYDIQYGIFTHAGGRVGSSAASVHLSVCVSLSHDRWTNGRTNRSNVQCPPTVGRAGV